MNMAGSRSVLPVTLRLPIHVGAGRTLRGPDERRSARQFVLLLILMQLEVVPGGESGVLVRVQRVRVREVSVAAGGRMVAFVEQFGRLQVMPGGLFVVFSGNFVMVLGLLHACLRWSGRGR